jgi:hypothetical protein
MHKGRHKAGGGSTSAATTSSSLLPVAESPGRDGLYRTASGGTPSKWRSGGKVAAVLPWAGQPRRRLHTALALLALLLCALLLSASRPSQQQVDAALPKQQQQLLLQVGEEQALIRQALGIQRHQEQQLGGHHASYLPEPAPRVALLFLVRGHMPLEPLWQAFFETAAQVGAARAAAPASARSFGVVGHAMASISMVLAQQSPSLHSRHNATADWLATFAWRCCRLSQ